MSKPRGSGPTGRSDEPDACLAGFSVRDPGSVRDSGRDRNPGLGDVGRSVVATGRDRLRVGQDGEVPAGHPRPASITAIGSGCSLTSSSGPARGVVAAAGRRASDRRQGTSLFALGPCRNGRVGALAVTPVQWSPRSWLTAAAPTGPPPRPPRRRTLLAALRRRLPGSQNHAAQQVSAMPGGLRSGSGAAVGAQVARSRRWKATSAASAITAAKADSTAALPTSSPVAERVVAGVLVEQRQRAPRLQALGQRRQRVDQEAGDGQPGRGRGGQGPSAAGAAHRQRHPAKAQAEQDGAGGGGQQPVQADAHVLGHRPDPQHRHQGQPHQHRPGHQGEQLVDRPPGGG